MKILDINEAIKEMRIGKRIIVCQSNCTAMIHKEYGDSHVWYCGTKLTQKKFKEFFGPNTKYGQNKFCIWDEWVEEDKKKRPWKYPNN